MVLELMGEGLLTEDILREKVNGFLAIYGWWYYHKTS
jgi:hypothetical protein